MPAPSAKGLQGSVIGVRMEELDGSKAEGTYEAHDKAKREQAPFKHF